MLNYENFKKLSLITFFIYIFYMSVGTKIYDSLKTNDELVQKTVMLDQIIKNYNISHEDWKTILSIVNPIIAKKVLERKNLEDWEANLCMCKVISAVIAIILQSLVIWLMYNAAWMGFFISLVQRIIHWKDTVLDALWRSWASKVLKSREMLHYSKRT